MKAAIFFCLLGLLSTACADKPKKEKATVLKPVSMDLGDGKSVNTVAFSPDGKTLITGGENKRIKLVDLETRKVVWTSEEQPDAVLSVSISPDGRFFAATCGDNTQQTAQVVLYDMGTKKEMWGRKNLVNNVQLVRFSPDGNKVYVANHYHITVHETTTGKQLYYFSGHPADVAAPSGHVDAVTDFAFTGDPDKFVTVGWDKNVKVWDLKAGREIKNFPEADAINACFLEDGDNLIVTAGAGGLHVWNRTTARIERSVAHKSEIKGLAIAGKYFVTIDETMAVSIWDQTDLKLLNSIADAHDLGIWGISSSPDGKWIATTGGAGVVKLWSIAYLLNPPVPASEKTSP